MAEVEDKKNVPETVEETLPKEEKEIKNIDTISTKLSTDQLICKSPQESPNASVKSLKENTKKPPGKFQFNGLLYLGILQIIFGIFMMVFGILVITHQASLSQFGAGIWGGCLAMATGIAGVFASAKTLCPLKSTAQTVARTVYLALSLISLAISQLVVVIAATGVARDINSTESDDKPHVYAPITEDYSIELPANYHTIMANLGLLTVAAIDCICAAFASYKSARDVCPCFRNQDESYRDFNMQHSHALVNSWLGNHGTGKQPQFYVVAAPPSTLGNVSKMSGHCTPVFAIPSPMVQPQLIGYPLIPAPLGPVPSPIIPPPNRREMMYKLQKKYRMRAKTSSREHTPKRSRSRSKSKSREREVTERDVASTYTGLDRTIAEEFIDILDSKNNSTCSSDYSCTSSCQSPSNECCNTNSDAASRDYLVNKI